MLKIGETIVVDNPTESLRDETGLFEVTTPAGDTLRVTCRPGHMIVSDPTFAPVAKIQQLTWRIRKLRALPEN